MVVGNTLVTLWETQGRSTVEKTNLDFEAYDQKDVQPAIWKTASYAQEPELTPSYMEERLLSPGSLTEKFLEAVFQPGVFSSLSLRAAIDQYTDACLTLPGAPPPQLLATYSTLCENVAAVVGCTVILNRDSQSGAFQYGNYWTALKRDWEGFVARCREVERSARWPLVLGSRGPDDVIVIERERAGSLVIEDMAIYLQRLIESDHLTDASFDILAVSGVLRQKLGPELMSNLEGRATDLIHQEFGFSLVDILQDQANKLQVLETLDEGSASWFAGRLQSIGDLDRATRAAIDAIGSLDYVVKREDDEADLSTLLPSTQSDWARGLTARYTAISVEARYQLSLSLITLLLYLSNDLPQWDVSLIAEVFAVFKGTAMLRYVSQQPAERPIKEVEGSFDDDVVSRMRNMDVSHNRIPSSAPTSLVYLLLAQSSTIGGIPVIAHTFLDNSGLLQSVSPSYATKFEVVFCERLRLLKFYDVARELLSCLPRTSSAIFVLAQVWLQIGRFDEAAQLFEKLAGSFGPDNALSPDDIEALTSLLPAAHSIQSHFAYYLFVSELFKTHMLTRYEVQFAQLAISTAPPSTDTSSLWATVTKGFADLGLYEEAYAALMTMPYEKQKREFAGQLALRMCEENAVAKLMTFDFAGISEEVESILSFKARNVDPRLQPSYSKILYTWYIQRGEYRNAAALVMYQRAIKLQEIITNVQLFISFGEEQLDSYSIAINALILVDENSQWVILPVVGDSARKRGTSSKYIPESKFTSSKYETQVVHLADIQRQHTLLSAQIAIIKRSPELLNSPEFLLPPSVLVLRLVHLNLFSQALTVANALKVDMTDLFTNLTAQCIRLSKNSEISPPVDSDWLLTDSSITWSGSTADRAWRFLRQSLERHDGAETDHRYTKACLETIISLDRSSPPPPWLLQIIQNHHPEYLIRLSLRYENIEDAVSYMLDLVKKVRAPSFINYPRNSELKRMLVWYQVIVAASSLPKPPLLLSQLRNEIANRMKRVQKLSHASA
ncbi:hypothetical protein EST38_g1210 [Candolleomyces aberdarensis]|uniref:Nuclear pore complex protein n=1 Tax=Candolleomyces aberdarensis TaxID=2316362 RepID=A0A4Q2DW12_9AGAR|nr:hypothetical protein EST38_g1210 [Candolleomyces aberdarensis]